MSTHHRDNTMNMNVKRHQCPQNLENQDPGDKLPCLSATEAECSLTSHFFQNRTATSKPKSPKKFPIPENPLKKRKKLNPTSGTHADFQTPLTNAHIPSLHLPSYHITKTPPKRLQKLHQILPTPEKNSLEERKKLNPTSQAAVHA